MNKNQFDRHLGRITTRSEFVEAVRFLNASGVSMPVPQLTRIWEVISENPNLRSAINEIVFAKEGIEEERDMLLHERRKSAEMIAELNAATEQLSETIKTLTQWHADAVERNNQIEEKFNAFRRQFFNGSDEDTEEIRQERALLQSQIALLAAELVRHSLTGSVLDILGEDGWRMASDILRKETPF